VEDGRRCRARFSRRALYSADLGRRARDSEKEFILEMVCLVECAQRERYLWNWSSLSSKDSRFPNPASVGCLARRRTWARFRLSVTFSRRLSSSLTISDAGTDTADCQCSWLPTTGCGFEGTLTSALCFWGLYVLCLSSKRNRTSDQITKKVSLRFQCSSRQAYYPHHRKPLRSATSYKFAHSLQRILEACRSSVTFDYILPSSGPQSFPMLVLS
jgi:hypothetical protein